MNLNDYFSPAEEGGVPATSNAKGDVNAAVHLAGENAFGRWSERKKEYLLIILFSPLRGLNLNFKTR